MHSRIRMPGLGVYDRPPVYRWEENKTYQIGSQVPSIIGMSSYNLEFDYKGTPYWAVVNQNKLIAISSILPLNGFAVVQDIEKLKTPATVSHSNSGEIQGVKVTHIQWKNNQVVAVWLDA